MHISRSLVIIDSENDDHESVFYIVHTKLFRLSSCL